jgi:PAS domain S-box-containing protein
MRQQKHILGQQGLQLNEQSLQILVETIPALMWRATPDGRIDYVNKRLLEYFGSPPDEIIGWGWMEKAHPDDVAFKSQTWLSNLETTTSYDVNCRFQGADGTYRWFNVRGEPLRDGDGNVQSWYGVFIDIDDQKKAEEKSRESELKLRQMIETVPGLVWSNGPDGEPTHINQRMLDYSGMSFEEFGQRGWEAFVHPADYPETAEAFWHAIQTGTSYQGVMRLRRADGEFRWHEARCEPLRDRQGRVIQWYGLSVEIDERKKAEDRLRRSEAYLAEAERLSHTGGWAVSRQGERTIVYWSEESYRIFGRDPLQGMPTRDWVWQQIHPDDRSRLREEADAALREKRDYMAAFRILLPGGTIKYLESNAHHLFSAGGELLEVMGTFVDVTERKRAEQVLRESEARLAATQRELRQIIDTIPILVVRYSTDARRDFVNAAWKQYTGLSDEAALGTDWSIVAHPDDLAIGEKMWRDTLAKGEPVHTEVRLRRADGEYRWFAVDRVALRDESGKVVKWYGTAYDIEQRKRAERALRDSEAKFRDFAETASDWFCEMGPDYKFTLLSENAFGSGAADRIGSACWDHALDLETEPEKWRLLQETVYSRKPFRDFVYRGLSGNGSAMYVRASGKPMFDANGEFRGYRGTCTDVTEIMRTQEALRESERNARSTIDGIASLVAIKAPNGEIETINHHFEYFGRSLEWLKNWATNDAVHPEDLPRVRELIKNGMASRNPYQFELRLRRFDGEYLWFDARSVPIRDDSGRILRWCILLTDIEGRKRAEQGLRESERNLRSVIDGIAGLVAVLASNGELESVNRQLLEYFGRSLEWAKDWGTNDMVHPEDRPRAVEDFTRAIASGLPYHTDQRLRGADGEYRWFETRGVPIRDDSGRIERWYVLLTDIEDRTRALARLDQMQADFAHINRVSMMGELAASLSHEITQPIASARNYARAAQNFLDMQPPDMSEVRMALSRVVGNTDRAGDILDRIRDHIKKTPPRKEHFDLNEAINEIIVLGRSAIIKNGVSVQTRLSEGLLPIHCDRVQLQQVVLNLLLNAAEAMGSVEAEPRELLISTEQHHTGVLVAVRDSGPGIDPTHLERVFDAFYTTKSRGVGMGLSICRSIIDSHGGRLWAEVNEPRGTIFQFSLPAVQV